MNIAKHFTRHLSLLLFCILLFFTTTTSAQKEVEAFNVDSTLYSYYQHCQSLILQPVVLNMADTLFQMANKKNDSRMQAVALSLKLDHYYYSANNEDSIVRYTNIVKDFAKATKQFKYYYFAWGNRLILYYLKTGRNNIALYEAEHMLKEAQTYHDKLGLLNCYNTLAHIYNIKGINKLAFEWQLKAIQLVEKEKIQDYNIAIVYTQVASYYIRQNNKSLALQMLKKAEANSNSMVHKVTTKLCYINYYTSFNYLSEAGAVLEECLALFQKDKRLESLKKSLYRTEALYYVKTKEYKKALEAFGKQENKESQFNEHALNNVQVRSKADIYYQMGDTESALKCLQEYLVIDDSLKTLNEQRATSEFATLLNLEKLNSEKKELLLQAQLKDIKSKKTLIVSLIGLLGLVFVFLYRENLLNRKLRLSESKLKQKNSELTDSREELRKAKDKAEASSKMKTTFIQSMSHEIRTPLNSIVGFSQILSDNYSQINPETKEFAEIIKTNSNDLLRLVTDVLTLSELDQHEELPSDIPTDIHACCQISLDLAKANKANDVSIQFMPSKGTLTLKSNPKYLTQALANLLHNAAKFTTQGVISLEYHVSEETKMIHFTVTDTGIGIPDEQREQIFERFYKINSFSQGTGLGLPISKSIAEKLKGDLILDSNYHEGCRFILMLPYTD